MPSLWEPVSFRQQHKTLQQSVCVLGSQHSRNEALGAACQAAEDPDKSILPLGAAEVSLSSPDLLL